MTPCHCAPLREALENLFALVQGEVPALLEDDHHFEMVTKALAHTCQAVSDEDAEMAAESYVRSICHEEDSTMETEYSISKTTHGAAFLAGVRFARGGKT